MAESSPDEGRPMAGRVTNKENARAAVVRIVSQGSFRDPEVGFQSGVGSGSGFIVSPDGLVVTNQHVVEGAGSVEVFIDGEDRPLNARILGVSECNDLAVLDLEGDDYPYFEWFEGPVNAGIDVWAAGFPMGDPEYSISRGSVVKAEADGETEWASFDFSIEHDATTEPGNSGGPVITEDGRVVGVHYAGGDLSGNGVIRRFAIPAELAIDVVEVLSQGQDQDSIGINGTAVADEDLAGIWVSGVRAGSPASDLGIEAGDVVLSLGGRDVVSQDDLDRYGFATKSGYCDVLRTQGTDRAIEITVLRFDTGEILSGELNNPDRPLDFVDSIASSITGFRSEDAVYQYQLIEDDSETIQVEAPVDWTSRDSSMWTFFDGEYPRIDVSTDLESYLTTWDTSGLTVIAAPGLDDKNIETTLEYFTKDFFVDADCDFSASEEYDNEDEEYPVTGIYDVYENCGGPGGAWFVVGVFYDQYYDVLIVVAAQAVTDADLEVIDRALATFYMP
jgi:serine protease Do